MEVNSDCGGYAGELAVDVYTQSCFTDAGYFFEKDSGLITTIVEYNSAIHSADGFDVNDVKDWMKEHGTLAIYPHATEAVSVNPACFIEKDGGLITTIVEYTFAINNGDGRDHPRITCADY